MNETNHDEDVRLPDGPVRFHPLCEAFPVMCEHELQRLAESIKTNRLREPIPLAPDGSILDGRSRFFCCERGGVVCATRKPSPPNRCAVSMALPQAIRGRAGEGV